MLAEASLQEPDAGAYVSVLGALDRDGRWEKAVAAVGRWRGRAVAPTAATATALLSAAAHGGAWRLAPELLSEARATALRADVALAATAVAGAWPRALEALGALQRRGLRPDAAAQAAVVTAAEKARRWAVALLCTFTAVVRLDVISFNAAAARWMHDLYHS